MRPLAIASPLLLGALLGALLGGCPPPGGGDDGPIGGGECFVDEECARGEVCARDEFCWPEGEVRAVRTTWTFRGMPANATTCAQHPNLYINFDGNVSDDLGFSPVPCETGLFTIDKLPRPFTRVEIGVKNGPWKATTISASGEVALDLSF